METKIICDTNIIIEFYKDNHQTTRILKNIGFTNISLSSVVIMELCVGARNQKELNKLKNYCSSLLVYHITNEISLKAIELIEKHSKSNGLTIPDALIAATGICENVPLFTYDKDFRSIEEIILYKY